ncbi:MAG TPA: phenylalanine--tRNA ligase subunit alpha [Candidatus Saccharimonadales bacterium]|nr:phenylalanine--tRNA ligase subunit alpha [Candidatus Saccharimonadales bacterium]
MNYQNSEIARVAKLLEHKIKDLPANQKSSVLRSAELKSLYEQVKSMPREKRAEFGREANLLKQNLEKQVNKSKQPTEEVSPIDLTAPFDINTLADKRPQFMNPEEGTRHPLMIELAYVLDIFYRMGFTAIESRQIDDDYHMFESLNFPEDHPARDDYDTFMTADGLIAPAHTSTMQNRVLKMYKSNLKSGLPIAVVIPGRVFRNEDLDARHEHTFYQLEGVYVDRGVNVGNLIATLQAFLEEYYQKSLEIKTQPFYFPFTEPSFELTLSCPFCDKAGCSICSYVGWIELLGCGMIHPNVLKIAGIDPKEYSGFAWGGGIDRLVMMKYDIEDIRHFEAGKLNFLRQFR